MIRYLAWILWNELNENEVWKANYIVRRQKPHLFSYFLTFSYFIMKLVSWIALQISRMVVTWNCNPGVVEINIVIGDIFLIEIHLPLYFTSNILIVKSWRKLTLLTFWHLSWHYLLQTDFMFLFIQSTFNKV